MPWFKVDDKLHSHKKVAKAGEAMALWAVAGSWCADQLTDGFVPDYMASRLMAGGDDMAVRLVDAGLWITDEHDGDQGWRFNDWTDYQPTREDVEGKRESARERMREVRAKRTGNRAPVPVNTDAGSQTVRANSRERSPYPDPTRPVPKEQDLAANAAPAQDDPSTSLNSSLKTPLAPDVAKTDRAAIFEALIGACRWDLDEVTTSARGAANRAAKELHEIGATPDGIDARSRVHLSRWPGCEVTPTSLAKNYALLGRAHPTVGPTGAKPDVDAVVAADDRQARKDPETGQWYVGGAA